MKKSTKILLGVGAAAAAGYVIKEGFDNKAMLKNLSVDFEIAVRTNGILISKLRIQNPASTSVRITSPVLALLLDEDTFDAQGNKLEAKDRAIFAQSEPKNTHYTIPKRGTLELPENIFITLSVQKLISLAAGIGSGKYKTFTVRVFLNATMLNLPVSIEQTRPIPNIPSLVGSLFGLPAAEAEFKKKALHALCPVPLGSVPAAVPPALVTTVTPAAEADYKALLANWKGGGEDLSKIGVRVGGIPVSFQQIGAALEPLTNQLTGAGGIFEKLGGIDLRNVKIKAGLDKDGNQKFQSVDVLGTASAVFGALEQKNYLGAVGAVLSQINIPIVQTAAAVLTFLGNFFTAQRQEEERRRKAEEQRASLISSVKFSIRDTYQKVGLASDAWKLGIGTAGKEIKYRNIIFYVFPPSYSGTFPDIETWVKNLENNGFIHVVGFKHLGFRPAERVIYNEALANLTPGQEFGIQWQLAESRNFIAQYNIWSGNVAGITSSSHSHNFEFGKKLRDHHLQIGILVSPIRSRYEGGSVPGLDRLVVSYVDNVIPGSASNLDARDRFRDMLGEFVAKEVSFPISKKRALHEVEELRVMFADVFSSVPDIANEFFTRTKTRIENAQYSPSVNGLGNVPAANLSYDAEVARAYDRGAREVYAVMWRNNATATAEAVAMQLRLPIFDLIMARNNPDYVNPSQQSMTDYFVNGDKVGFEGGFKQFLINLSDHITGDSLRAPNFNALTFGGESLQRIKDRVKAEMERRLRRNMSASLERVYTPIINNARIPDTQKNTVKLLMDNAIGKIAAEIRLGDQFINPKPINDVLSANGLYTPDGKLVQAIVEAENLNAYADAMGIEAAQGAQGGASADGTGSGTGKDEPLFSDEELLIGGGVAAVIAIGTAAYITTRR